MTPEQRRCLEEKINFHKNMNSSELEDEILSTISIIKKTIFAESIILPEVFAYLGVCNKLHISKKIAQDQNCPSWAFNMLLKYSGLPMISKSLFFRV